MAGHQGGQYVSGGTAIATLGAAFFGLYILYIALNDAYQQGPIWLLPLGLVLTGVLSAGLIYGGYWVCQSGFTDDQGWRVTIWLFAGLIGALALTFWPIFYQRIVGVTIEDPIFILLVSSGLGANAGVVAGVSQVRSERQLHHVKQARNSLEFLNRLLRHNVLNAISIIHGNAELLIEQGASESTVARAQTIRRQSEQITTVVQNTKALVQRVEHDPGLEPIDLDDVVLNELETARASYEEAVFEWELASGVTVHADPLVSMVVQNLLSNAVVHSDQETPTVEINLETAGGRAVLEITDDGPGISDRNLEQLVDPGQHGDRGLGLYLVETLVCQYDGSFQLGENDPRGTVARVELPLA